ncbi:hypothetical protein ACHAXR_001967, partial [Thalassiosira sp. AJA248-18]
RPHQNRYLRTCQPQTIPSMKGFVRQNVGPFPLALWGHYCLSLEALQESCMGLVNASNAYHNLKPENILISNSEETTYELGGLSQRVPVCTKVKVIGFGGAVPLKHEAMLFYGCFSGLGVELVPLQLVECRMHHC